jgi:acyl carrier protein
MRTSSRTPEGVPGNCPVCDAVLCLEPVAAVGGAPCPYCDRPLWFVHFAGHMLFYPEEAVSEVRRQRFAAAFMQVGQKQGLDLRMQDELDSLDLIDIFRELERAMGVHISEKTARQIRNVRDLIDLLVLD